jgi:transcriptional regulator with XRE-family HTH domain
VDVNPVAFKTIRELAGFSQAELARRSGVSQGHISQIEAGQKRPRPQTVHKFAAALGVPIGSLLCSDADVG